MILTAILKRAFFMGTWWSFSSVFTVYNKDWTWTEHTFTVCAHYSTFYLSQFQIQCSMLHMFYHLVWHRMQALLNSKCTETLAAEWLFWGRHYIQKTIWHLNIKLFHIAKLWMRTSVIKQNIGEICAEYSIYH